MHAHPNKCRHQNLDGDIQRRRRLQRQHSYAHAYRYIVVKGELTTALTSTPNPSAIGQVAVFTATVTGPGSTPTGDVTFSEGTAMLGTTPLNNGVATFSIDVLAAGSHAIVATYSGDANFNGSTATRTHIVTSSSKGELDDGAHLCVQSIRSGSISSVHGDRHRTGQHTDGHRDLLRGQCHAGHCSTQQRSRHVYHEQANCRLPRYRRNIRWRRQLQRQHGFNDADCE